MISSIQYYLERGLTQFKGWLWRVDSSEVNDAVETLRQVSILQGLSRSNLRELAQAMHYRDYKRGEIIYYENDPGLGLYFIQKGRVRLMTQDEENTTHELRQTGENEFFGELSVLGEFKRLETSQAVTETRLLGFFRPDLKTIIKRNPRLGGSLLLELAQHIARRQAEMIAQQSERDGKVPTLQLWHGTASAPASHGRLPVVSS